jgi:hypothetical protein
MTIVKKQHNQVDEYLNHKSKTELSLETKVFLSFKHRTPNRYKLLDKLIRANINPETELTEKTVYLGEKAKKLLRTILKKLFSNRYVLINHKYITQATRCKSDQNTIILKELKRILKIQFYRLYTSDKGTKFSRHYYIELHPTIVQELKDTGVDNLEFCPEKNRATYTNRNIFNKDKNIDLESNFLKNSKEIKKQEKIEPEVSIFPQERVKPIKLKKRLPNERKKPTNAQAKAKIYKPFAYSKPKTIADMLPLIDDATCDELRSKSGRPFSNNFITQLVLKMSKDPNIKATFDYKSGFIAYMAKALLHEKHDAIKTENINFRFKVNIPIINKELQKLPEPLKLPDGVWGDICSQLIETCGIHIYNNWFSKLTPVIDESAKTIILKAPNSFIQQWIDTNYGDIIQETSKKLGFNLKVI